MWMIKCMSFASSLLNEAVILALLESRVGDDFKVKLKWN